MMVSEQSFTIREIAEVAGISKRAIEQRAGREKWCFTEESTRGGKRRHYAFADLPEPIQIKLLLKYSPPPPPKPQPDPATSEALWQRYGLARNGDKERADRSLQAIYRGHALIDAGYSKKDAWTQIADECGVTTSTVYRWLDKIKGVHRGDWLPALLTGYQGRTKQAQFDGEAWLFIQSDYLRLEQPGFKACYRRLERAAAEHGWTIPAMRTVERRLKAIPRSQRILFREGQHALSQSYPSQERTVKDLQALEGINGDGYQHNVFVIDEAGQVYRPKTWFWQDIYSRKMLAHRTDETENSDTIRLSLGDVLKLGTPLHVTIDNTRAAANKWLSGGVKTRYRFKVKEDDVVGLFPRMGIQVHWTSVNYGKGHGQAKPIERAFGVGGMGEVVDKHPAFAGAYTGANVNAKPENYRDKAVPLEKFLAVLEAEVNAWNAREGRRTEMCQGVKSFDQVFDESYASSTIRKLTDDQSRLWMLTAEAVKVQRDGTISLAAGAKVGQGRDGHNRYQARELIERVGTKVVVRFDPENLHDHIHVETLAGKSICRADCIERSGFYSKHAGAKHNRLHRGLQKDVKRAAKKRALMDAMEVDAMLPYPGAPDTPEATVVAGEFGALSTTVGADRAEPVVASPIMDVEDRWRLIESRVAGGECLSDEDQRFYEHFPSTDTYRRMIEWDAEVDKFNREHGIDVSSD